MNKTEHEVVQEPTLTERQRILLLDLYKSDGAYLTGADVRVARALESHGLVKVEDYGEMKDVRGRSDGERWCIEMTATGRALAAKLQGLSCPLCHSMDITKERNFGRVVKDGRDWCMKCGWLGWLGTVTP